MELDEYKAKLKEYKRQYYLKNKERLQAKNKAYYKKNKEVIKEWRVKNKQKRDENNGIYREKHKEKIALKSKEQYYCDCGSISTYAGKYAHFKSKKHKDFINKN
jgi:hypothetical protein